MKLYELVSNLEDGVSFSPFVITTELMLKHKGLEFESVPITWVNVGPKIRELTNDKWDKVPTLELDNGEMVYNSLEIAKHLDETYSDNPIITNDKELDDLIENYQNIISQSVSRLLANILYDKIDEESRPYFKKLREEAFNEKFENIEGDYETNVLNYYDKTTSITNKLKNSKFLDGESPKIHDYYLIGRVQQIKSINFEVYEALIINHPSNEFRDWTMRMENLFNGYLRDRKTSLN